MVFAMILGLVLGVAAVLLIGQWLRGELIAAPDAAGRAAARRPARRHPARPPAHPSPRAAADAPRRRRAA